MIFVSTNFSLLAIHFAIILEVIKTFKNGRSPGTDGLPIEFYKIFWNDIKNLVLNSFSYSYEQKNKSVSQKPSIITLLSKRDKDTRIKRAIEV
jgi:hypothetical protein